jgi:hypothetical protein
MDDVSINKKALLLIKTLSISLFKFLRWPPVSPPCPTDRGDGLPARGDGLPARGDGRPAKKKKTLYIDPESGFPASCFVIKKSCNP